MFCFSLLVFFLVNVFVFDDDDDDDERISHFFHLVDVFPSLSLSLFFYFVTEKVGPPTSPTLPHQHVLLFTTTSATSFLKILLGLKILKYLLLDITSDVFTSCLKKEDEQCVENKKKKKENKSKTMKNSPGYKKSVVQPSSVCITIFLKTSLASFLCNSYEHIN